MFPAKIYVERRQRLKSCMQTGLLLFLGHEDSAMNYPDNAYPFRQDSSFLYFYGLDFPGLAAIIDIEDDKEIVFGNDPTVDDIIWTGPQPTLAEQCEQAGVHETAPLHQLQVMVRKASQQGRAIHLLPQYRPENILRMAELLGIHTSAIQDYVSETFIKAVVAQRSLKGQEEIEEIEAALDITYAMHTHAMKMSAPGMCEREVAGAMEGIALSRGGRLAFFPIFSIHGETLHNHFHGNRMNEGDVAVNDSGAESSLHYASDITRTIPVSGQFTEKQKEIYTAVLNAQQSAIDAVKPGVEFRDIHRLACRSLAAGLKDIGLMKGNIEEAVHAGAHTLFFPCGVGHMMGLDVHDMEGLGEDYVGYTDTVKRNPAFGWRSLRLAKALEPGFVLTVEPGLYFIPALIDRWKAEKTCFPFINYDAVDTYRAFGGVRLEDDVLVVEGGHRVLGRNIPKTIDEVEETSSGKN